MQKMPSLKPINAWELTTSSVNMAEFQVKSVNANSLVCGGRLTDDDDDNLFGSEIIIQLLSLLYLEMSCCPP